MISNMSDRPIKGLEQSLKEMKLIRQGKLKGKAWDDIFSKVELDKVWEQAEKNLKELEREGRKECLS